MYQLENCPDWWSQPVLLSTSAIGVTSNTSLQRHEYHIWRHTLTTKVHLFKHVQFSRCAPGLRSTNEAPIGAFGPKDGLLLKCFLYTAAVRCCERKGEHFSKMPERRRCSVDVDEAMALKLFFTLSMATGRYLQVIICRLLCIWGVPHCHPLW